MASGLRPWHALPPDEVACILGADLRDGLDPAEAARRLGTDGPNVVEEQRPDPWWSALLRQFVSPLVALLAAAVVVSVVVGDTTDAVVIAAIVVMNSLLGFVQEWRAEHAIDALRRMLAPRATVRRGGEPTEIDAADLVTGDLVELAPGRRVPADLRLVDGTAVLADEAVLTGESVPVAKSVAPVRVDAPLAERTSLLHAATVVTDGLGTGLVVATGPHTELGRIAHLTGSVERVATPLQRELGHLGRSVGAAAVIIGAVIVVLGLAAGRAGGDMLLTGVSLAVAVVPEGLPAVVTVTLALGIRSMARQRALIRRLEAAETLGAATVVCTDKTGTLTTNEMVVTQLWTPEGSVGFRGTGYEPRGSVESIPGSPLPNRAVLEAVAATAVSCNHAGLDRRDDDWRPRGAPTEAALLTMAGRLGCPIAAPAPSAELPFSSVRKRMDVVVDDADGRWVHTKGAPDAVIAACSHELRSDGPVRLTAARRSSIEGDVDRMAASGLRTLALARRRLDHDETFDETTVADGLTILGVVGILDPPRDEVPAAVATARAAGITVVMITGDAGPTALAVASAIGLPAVRVVTGPELDRLDDPELRRALDGSVAFARTSPEHKLRIVRVLQAAGEVVAMTGDGVNDSPALRQAEIGIAMGVRGTDAAKAAADLVLTDDNFATIVVAIREGRRQYANIRRFVRYLLSSNLGEVVAITGNLLLGGPAILLPVQILWMNLVTDGATAVALGLERAEPDLMERPPRPPRAPILDRASALTVAVVGTVIGLAALAVFETARAGGASDELAQTLGFTSLVVFEKANVFNFRTDRAALATIGWLSNRWLVVAWLAAFAAHVAAVHAGVLQRALHTVSMRPWHWLALFTIALPLVVGGEAVKALLRRRAAGAPTGAAPGPGPFPRGLGPEITRSNR